jgi:hypothetical protein
VSFYCAECVMNWWPYQCKDGKCPVCGGGTTCKHGERADLDADARFKAAADRSREREASAKAHAAFEAFYLDRERALNGLDALPVTKR